MYAYMTYFNLNRHTSTNVNYKPFHKDSFGSFGGQEYLPFQSGEPGHFPPRNLLYDFFPPLSSQVMENQLPSIAVFNGLLNQSLDTPCFWLSKTRPKADTLGEVCFSGHDIFPGKDDSPIMEVENDQETTTIFPGSYWIEIVSCSTSTRNLFKMLASWDSTLPIFLVVGVPSDTRT